MPLRLPVPQPREPVNRLAPRKPAPERAHCPVGGNKAPHLGFGDYAAPFPSYWMLKSPHSPRGSSRPSAEIAPLARPVALRQLTRECLPPELVQGRCQATTVSRYAAPSESSSSPLLPSSVRQPKLPPLELTLAIKAQEEIALPDRTDAFVRPQSHVPGHVQGLVGLPAQRPLATQGTEEAGTLLLRPGAGQVVFTIDCWAG
jgi:hypothetical protein